MPLPRASESPWWTIQADQHADPHDALSTAANDVWTQNVGYDPFGTAAISHTVERLPGKRLIHARKSHESQSASAKSPSPTDSAWLSNSCKSGFTVSSAQAPRTPSSTRISPNKSTITTPFSTRSSPGSRYPYQIPQGLLCPPITPPELAEAWSQAVNLYYFNNFQSARLIFNQLLIRSGVPSHFQLLIAANIGLILLKEHAAVPALQLFHVTARDLCSSGPLFALVSYFMGIAAWDSAISLTAQAQPGAEIEQTDPYELFPKRTIDSVLDLLSKSTTFFLVASGETSLYSPADRETPVSVDFTSLGYDFLLSQSKISQNIRLSHQAWTLRCLGDPSWAETTGPIHRVPDNLLFLPREVNINYAPNMPSGRHEPTGGGSSDPRGRNTSTNKMQNVDQRMMKQLPPPPPWTHHPRFQFE